MSPYLWEDLKLITSAAFTTRYTFEEPITVGAIQTHYLSLVGLLLPDLMIIWVVTAFFGAGAMAAQTKFLFSTKLLKPKWSNINPVSGLKRLFSMRNMVNVIKAVAKLAIICPIAYFAFFDLFPEFLRLMDIPITDLLPFTAKACNYIFWKIIFLLLILAILDYLYNFWEWKQNIKMSKTEVKEESKATEGDMKTKNRIKAIGMQRLRQLMIQSVPEADVVVTNPTHIAVALKYDLKSGGAPKVVAKGKAHLAENIKKIAREHKIPVIERKPLARALYKAVEVGQEIPYEFYKAVAELLAYVYRIKGKNPLKGRPRQARA
jgi:flagellar biosynthetic protein FlhB